MARGGTASPLVFLYSYNAWSPTNGMCLAWPPASRVAKNATDLLQKFQVAANSTMMNNLLPYIKNHPNSGYGSMRAQRRWRPCLI